MRRSRPRRPAFASPHSSAVDRVKLGHLEEAERGPSRAVRDCRGQAIPRAIQKARPLANDKTRVQDEEGSGVLPSERGTRQGLRLVCRSLSEQQPDPVEDLSAAMTKSASAQRGTEPTRPHLRHRAMTERRSEVSNFTPVVIDVPTFILIRRSRQLRRRSDRMPVPVTARAAVPRCRRGRSGAPSRRRGPSTCEGGRLSVGLSGAG